MLTVPYVYRLYNSLSTILKNKHVTNRDEKIKCASFLVAIF